jgi:hypothetical protein
VPGEIIGFASQKVQESTARVAGFNRSFVVFLNLRKMLSHHPAFSAPRRRLSLRCSGPVDHRYQSTARAAVSPWGRRRRQWEDLR